MKLALDAVAVARGARTILSGLSLSFAPGSIAALAGPNGAGKSSLMACIAGDLAPQAGQLLADGQPLSGRTLAQWAQMRAMLRQSSEIAFGFAVRDVVAMGLHPHGVAPQSPSGRRLVDQALHGLDLVSMSSRPATLLSGGETQRVQIARVMVQMLAALERGEGALLLLDEPTTGLDYRHQLALLAMVRDMARAGATVICSLHDLPFACRMAERLLLLGGGRLVADLAPAALSSAEVAQLYGIDRAEAALLLGRPDPVWTVAA